MRLRPSTTSQAFWASVVVGTFAGQGLQTLFTVLRHPLKWSEAWLIAVLIGGYGMLTLPFVTLGLALFGLPLARLLRAGARHGWIGIVAIVGGAICGKLLVYAIDHLLFFGLNRIDRIEHLDLGILYGVSTAIAWWLFQRRVLATRAGEIAVGRRTSTGDEHTKA